MSEPFKINRVLPPHELNARRNRKRVLPQPPPVAPRPAAHEPNPHAVQHATDRITSHQ